MTIIKNLKIYAKHKIINNGYIIFDDIILEVGENYPKDDAIDGKGLSLIPGFIDTHMHGAYGVDVCDNQNVIGVLSKNLPQEGVTSFFLSTMTESVQNLEISLERLSKQQSLNNGASFLGFHLEGPFISKDFRGSQNIDNIIPPSIDIYQKLAKASHNMIKQVTIAPEVDGALELIKNIGKDVTVAIGHSNASYDDCIKALQNGAKLFTHGYNAMSKLNHRNLGCVGAMLLEEDPYVELIADLIHVDENAIKLLYKNKKDKLILITDSTKAKGIGDKESNLGLQKVIIKNGAAYLESGTLAGSILKYIDGVKNFKKATRCSISEIIKITSTNISTLYDLQDTGYIDIGLKSDLIVIDNDLNIKNVYCRGNRII